MPLAVEALNESKELIADLNAEQLAQGIQTDGAKSNFTYTPFTIAVKRTKTGLASVTDHLTNFDTGESYRSLFAEFTADKATFGTKTDKEDAINDRMNGKAFGLTDDNRKMILKSHANIAFIQKIRTFIYER